MAMTTDETIQFYREELEYCLGIVEDAKKLNDYDLVVLNLTSSFEYQILIAMLFQRLGDVRVLDELKNASSIFYSAIKLLPLMNPSAILWKDFLLCEGIFVECILTGEIKKEFLIWFPEISEIDFSKADEMDKILDVLTIKLLVGDDVSLWWENTIKKIESESRLKLLAETYEGYKNLICAGKNSDWSLFKHLFGKQASFYDMRKKDSYFKNGSDIEGGEEPDELIDYRISALVNFFLRRGLELSILPKSPHIWGGTLGWDTGSHLNY